MILWYYLCILVTPGTPKNVSARFSLECLTVSWEKVESGNCTVSYTVQYNRTKITYNRTNSLMYHECNFHASAKDSVSIQAEVDGRTGSFSGPVFVTTIIPVPIHQGMFLYAIIASFLYFEYAKVFHQCPVIFLIFDIYILRIEYQKFEYPSHAT